jgi:N-methylhydantoinase B
MFERINNRPRGRNGGTDGAAGRVSLASGATLRAKGQQGIPPYDRLRLEMAGGGGWGDPFARPAERVAEDVRNGVVSVESARTSYGVVLDDSGRVDQARTEALRGPSHRV